MGAEIEGIGPAALWLAASLAAHERKSRPDAMGWLERLLETLEVICRSGAILRARSVPYPEGHRLQSACQGPVRVLAPL